MAGAASTVCSDAVRRLCRGHPDRVVSKAFRLRTRAGRPRHGLMPLRAHHYRISQVLRLTRGDCMGPQTQNTAFGGPFVAEAPRNNISQRGMSLRARRAERGNLRPMIAELAKCGTRRQELRSFLSGRTGLVKNARQGIGMSTASRGPEGSFLTCSTFRSMGETRHLFFLY